MKRLLSHLLIVSLLLSLLPFSISAASGGTTGNLSWFYEDGVLTISGYGAMPDYDSLYADTRAPWYHLGELVHTVVLKNGVTSIGAEAFCRYDGITKFEIPSSVRRIGDYAFMFCSSLTEVTFPNSLTYIGEGALSYCPLKEIILPESLTQISNKAFYYCYKATKLEYSSRLTNIGTSAFEGCAGIKEVTIHQQMNIGNSAFCDSGLTKLIIPDRTEGAGDITLGKHAFDGCYYLEDVYIGDSITSISDYAFANCQSLKNLTIGNRVSKIGIKAFSSNTSLREVTFPDSLTLIDDFAFEFCTGLKKITMGASPLKTDQYAFDNCTALEGVYISDLSAWCKSDLYGYGGNPLHYSRKLYLDGVLVEHLVIPNDVTQLYWRAFMNMSDLKTVLLHPDVYKIGSGVFTNCTNIERIIVLDPNCEIVAISADAPMGSRQKTVLHGWAGSTLETYAATYGYAFTYHIETIEEVAPPTCKDSGQLLHYCAVCNHSYTEETAPLGHKYASSSTEATCTEGSVTTFVCERCGDSYETVSEPLDHNYIAEVTAPTCELDGFTTYTCSACGDCYTDDVIAAFGHNYEIANQIDATCETNGSITYQCTACEENYLEEIAALGHDLQENIIDATCQKEGYVMQECSRCEYSYPVEVLPILPHQDVAYVTPPTCEEEGYTAYCCSICGESYFADFIPATGHNFVPCENAAVPNCLSGGVVEYVCTACEMCIFEYIAPKQHTYIDTVVKPTCTEGGYTEKLCTVCGYYTTNDFTSPTGHLYAATTTSPTCTQAGYTDYRCEHCGDSYRGDDIPAEGHHYKNGVCTTCGEVDENYVEIPNFIDVPSASWFKEAVDYVVQNGLMNGMSANTFEPNTTMNRAMLVTVLWRYAGSPMEGVNHFVDVPNGQWYTDAVAWAAYNGIVGGVGNNQFAPNGNITREQLATILYRYCNSLGLDTSSDALLSSFIDCDKISSYAFDAMIWAVAEGLINGIEKNGRIYLDPQGNATRAQVATILMRFIENYISSAKPAGYDAIIRQAMNTYGSEVDGILYDIDANGIKELILLYAEPYDPQEPDRMPVQAYSIYTMQNGTVIPLLQDQILYAHAGGTQGWVGVVETGGEQFFAAYRINPQYECQYGQWTIYRINSESIGLQTQASFYCQYNENREIDYANSYCDFNGEKLDYEYYESWVGAIKQIEIIDGFRPSNLESLLNDHH